MLNSLQMITPRVGRGKLRVACEVSGFVSVVVRFIQGVRLVLATPALVFCGIAAATDAAEKSAGYDADAVAMIEAIEAREATRDASTLVLPEIRVRGKSLKGKTGTHLMGESAPDGGVLYIEVDEGWRAKHNW